MKHAIRFSATRSPLPRPPSAAPGCGRARAGGQARFTTLDPTDHSPILPDSTPDDLAHGRPGIHAKPATTLLALAAAGLWLVACGGGTSSQPSPAAAATKTPDPSAKPHAVHEKGSGTVRTQVGRGGGTLELANGARLEIPADTFTKATTVVLTEGKATTAFANYDDQEPVGPVVSATPSMQPPEGETVVFSAPRQTPPEGFSEDELVLAVEELAEEQRAFGENTTVTRWAYVPAEIESGRMKAELPTHPGMRLQFLWSKD